MRPSTHTILLMAGTLTLSARFEVLTAAFVLTAVAHSQTTWYVDDDNCPEPGSGTQADPYCSIQAAIDAGVDTDEIVVAPGTYFETINFLGKAITLRSSGGPDVTTIDAQLAGTVVSCTSGEGFDTVLDGFTITGGTGTLFELRPDTFRFGGGGMFNNPGSPTVTNCMFTGNTADRRGGMFNRNSSPTVTNCTFIGNTASDAAGSGGGMSNYSSSPTVTNCEFSGNSAFGGGGMGNSGGSPTVSNCTFSGNTASFGGGMRNIVSSPTVSNCTFTANTAGAGGGGMDNASNSSPTVTDCSFSGNIASFAAGMKNYKSSPTVTNCKFSGNAVASTQGSGGGMSNINSSPTVTNCTFTANTAGSNGGVGGGMINFESSPTVTNCILSGNSPDEISDVRSATTVTFSDVQGGFPGLGNIDADPLYIDADGPDDIPGTDDDDLRLSPGSPCIDAADNTVVPNGINTDLDGNLRFEGDPATPVTGRGECPIVDMGAYEFQPAMPCPWDLDCNGGVEMADLLVLLAAWSTNPGGPPDFDGDGVVSVPDLLSVLAAWGPCL